MEKDTYKTDVIFRDWQSPDFNCIIALFPYDVNPYNGFCLSYEHVGQHSDADYNGVINSTIPAKEKDYVSLKSELESLGYDLNIIKKRNYTRFLEAFHKINTETKK